MQAIGFKSRQLKRTVVLTSLRHEAIHTDNRDGQCQQASGNTDSLNKLIIKQTACIYKYEQ